MHSTAICVLAAYSAFGSAVPSNYPSFSWDTVPLFWHSANASGPFSPAYLSFIGNRFPLITIEKGMSSHVAPAGTDAEAKIVREAKQIKQAIPTAKVLFYLNSIMDWDMYNLHKTMEAHPENWLKDDNGDYVKVVGQYVFDHSKESCREYWLDTLAQAKQSGAIDGAFLDRGNYYGSSVRNLSPARRKAWDEGHDLIERGAQEIFADGVVILNNANNPGVNGRMYERWGDKDFDRADLLADIRDLQQQSTNYSYPHVAEAHGEPNDENPHAFNASLAAFLMGAGPYSYFGCTPGWSVTSGWDHWYPQYDLPLGAPLSGATAAIRAELRCPGGRVGRLAARNATLADAALVARRHRSRLGASSAGAVIAKGAASACGTVAAGDGAVVTSWETSLSRSFASGTKACLALESGGAGPGTPCIHWSSGRVDGPAGCRCE